jgi:hypothetical protein
VIYSFEKENYSLPSVELDNSIGGIMERIEALRDKGIDEEEWQKSYYRTCFIS